MIGYGIPTAGRLCAAPISGMGQPGQVAWPTLLECTRECNYEPGLIVERGGHSPTMRLIMSQNAHSWAHSSTMSPSALIVEL